MSMSNAKLNDPARLKRLLPDGKPRYVRCYDSGEKDWDRFTVLYTGNYAGRRRGTVEYVGMSVAPFHPMGCGQHGEGDSWMDRSYKHLGKKIRFDDLPEDCKKVVMRDYLANWRIDRAALQ